MPSSNPNIVSLEKRLLGLYTAACAPLSGDTLVNDLADLEPTDFTVATSIDEIRFLKGLTDAGFSTIAEAIDTLPREMIDDQDDNSLVSQAPEVSVALLSAATFATRLAFVATQLHHICMHTVDRLAADPTALMKELEQRAKDGERPAGEDGEILKKVLDFTPNAKWKTMEVPLKNRVGFKKTTAVISEGKIEEEALKVSEVRRKKQRNPTGYHKFNFKDLGLEDSDIEGESRSRASSARGGSTDGSTRGSISAAGTGGGPMTSRSVSSGAEDTDYFDDESMQGKNPFQLGERSASTVVFSFDRERQMIQDVGADPDWEQQGRHQKRFSRIRNRVPTGHPSLMKGHSDELEGIVNEYEKSLTTIQLDDKTAVNTEANKCIQSRADDEAAEAAARAAAAAMGNAKRNVTLPQDA